MCWRTRFPIYVDFCNNILKYYFYACQKSEDSLVGQTLLVSKKLHQSGDKSWFLGVNTILKEINVDETNCNKGKFSLKNMYKELWCNKLQDEAIIKKGKLRTFYNFKSLFQKEIYLDIIKDRNHQQALTKLRISAHKLEIESGRYTKKQVSDRLCKKCFQNEVEDEVHFICDCSFYNRERLELFDYINRKVPNFVSLSSHDKFIWLMTCENEDILNRCG